MMRPIFIVVIIVVITFSSLASNSISARRSSNFGAAFNADRPCASKYPMARPLLSQIRFGHYNDEINTSIYNKSSSRLSPLKQVPKADFA